MVIFGGQFMLPFVDLLDIVQHDVFFFTSVFCPKSVLCTLIVDIAHGTSLCWPKPHHPSWKVCRWCSGSKPERDPQ
jgi:hypothetical protein